MDANGRPETMADLLAVMGHMEHNVISTGVGNLPISPSLEIQQFYQTANAAAMSTVHDPMLTMDRVLVTTISPRLANLTKAVKTGKEKARFRVAETPKTKATTEALREQATTITIGTTTIRPMVDEGVAR